MYILMITDLTWTLLHHEEAGEMNPLFARLLSTDEMLFVYIKLAANSVAALIVLYLRPRKPIISHILAWFGIIIYGVVVYLHWFVWNNLQHAEKVQNSILWDIMQKGGN